ncbi:Hypothetical predicted protein [Mytilus galloprovincialis]|uniref:C-type lectin domain-containing protein n=1 Tax=Mytilus galloprovincialis TaxID=29158 RepID=A0A8B6FLM8_MYTGA|nr:Hypothetical predicted protein [Mytilus galloprovincialis]
MLHIALCIAFYDVIVSVILAQTVRTYTNCVQVGTTSVNKNSFLERDCKSAIGGAIMCRESAQCTDFTYDDLTKSCHLYQMNDTIKCDLNEKNGGMTFSTEKDFLVDWQRLGNTYYFYENTTKRSWDDAALNCLSQGGYLADVTDEVEFQLVNSIINDDVFIGCRRYNGNLEWTTSGLMLLPNDTRWAPGEPKTEECVQIWAGKFDDTSCLDEKKFVCEKAVLFV